MTTLGEVANYHAEAAKNYRSLLPTILDSEMRSDLERQIALHERFAVAIREADGDDTRGGA